ncbi:sensor domain-containing protein, partial [Streptomyces badius]
MATAYGPDTRDREHEGSAPGFGGKTRTKHFLPAPLRAPLEARAWSELLYALLSFPLSTVMFVFAVTMTSLSAGLMVTFVGIPVLAVGLAVCRGFGSLERLRARALLRVEVADPEPVRGKTGGPMSWMGAILKSGVSWRHLLYTLLHFPWAVFTFVVAISFWTYGLAGLTYPLWFWLFPAFAGQDGIQLYGDRTHAEYLNSPLELAATGAVGLVLVMAAPWVVRGLLTVDRLMVTGLLGPSRLATRVSELESDRGVVVDTAAA